MKKTLSEKENEKVQAQVSNKNEKKLFTIGYEGISVEKYFNKLILEDVKVLCDVRNNPLSRKYGFSKSHLQMICNNLNIKYVHIPELGIKGQKRQNLKTQADYNLLFQDYAKETLLNATENIQKILDLLEKYQRVALTCFEASHHQCHRNCLSQKVVQISTKDFKTKYL